MAKRLFFITIFIFLSVKFVLSCSVDYSGPCKERIMLAMDEIRKSDPAYYRILEGYSDYISGCPYEYSTASIVDGKYWILLSAEIIERSDIKKIAATIIHESLHNFYARTGQYANFNNVFEEEEQSYLYALRFLIEIKGNKSDILWYEKKAAKYKAKSKIK